MCFVDWGTKNAEFDADFKSDEKNWKKVNEKSDELKALINSN